MPSLLKILLPLVAVGAVATITFIAVPSGTTLVSLKDIADYKYPSSTTNAKFGALFSHFFLSTTHKENDAEWESRAKEINGASSVSGTLFNNLTNSTTAKQLKDKCKSVYDNTTFAKTDDSKSGTKWGEVWELCSLGKTAPVIVNNLETNNLEKKKTESSGEWTSKYGSSKKEDILSLTHKNNDWIWGVLNSEFGTGYLTFAQQNKLFKKSENSKSLKELCEVAYNTATSETTKVSADEVLKYCSLKRPQTN